MPPLVLIESMMAIENRQEQGFYSTAILRFARKVCRFDSSPLQRQKYASSLPMRILLLGSNGVDCSLHRRSLAVRRASQTRDRKPSVEPEILPLTQSLTGLPERFAVRRASAIQK
jgi:hypothetical protein